MPAAHAKYLTGGMAPSRGLVLASVALIAVIGVYLQWTTHLNHDVSWILHSAKWMLNGAEFGKDIIAANPPLAWLLALPSAAASQYLHLDPVISFRILLVIAIAGALICALFLHESSDGTTLRWDTTALVVVLAYFLFIGCFRDFGQREHMCLILATPYLALAISRLEDRSAAMPLAVAIGAAAGIAFALKPYFLAVPVCVELATTLHRRKLTAVWRPETIAAGATIVLYAASIPFLAPDYLFEVLPLIRGVYWGFDNGVLDVIRGAQIEIIGFVISVALCLAGRRRTASQIVLLAASLGFLAAYVLQQKGYTYHLLPLRATVAMSLVLHLVDSLNRQFGTDRQRWFILASALAASTVVFGLNVATVVDWHGAANRQSGRLARTIDEIVAVVDNNAKNKTFLAISTHPFPGFPTALYAQSEWAGRTNSQILLPAIVKMRAQGIPDNDARLSSAEHTAHTMFLHDLAVGTPAVVLVDARARRHAIDGLAFDFVQFYLEDPEIRRIWSEYAEMPPVAGFRVFVRRLQ